LVLDMVPPGNSTTMRALFTLCENLQEGMLYMTAKTSRFAFKKRTSMGNRMKKVCIAEHGWITSAVPSGRDLLPMSPFSRVRNVVANSK